MKGKWNKMGKLKLAFDVGHSSIGWAVLGETGQTDKPVELLGCGTVIFRADDCLARSRRAYRRQRRHIRSTRQRIERMKRLLAHVGVLTREELDKPGCAWPWKLAAQVLSGKSGGNPSLLLNWPELWDVLRWYAHNRGYDGNRRWSGGEEPGEDTEKVENANALMAKFGAETMAETICAICGIDPLGAKKSSNVNGSDRFKGRNAAFPREVVESEVRRVLGAHAGRLKGLTEELTAALLEDASALPCPEIRLPKRYEGGLLFGQLVPRFDNRIISKCPVTGEKVPNRKTREFLDFRWGMQLANVKVAKAMEPLRRLSAKERQELDRRIRLEGRFTAKQFTDAVREVTGCERDNLETMLTHPDAAEALVVDPVQQLVRKGIWENLFPRVSQRVQKRARGRLWNGKRVTLGDLRDWEAAVSGNAAEFDAELARLLEGANTRKKKKEKALTREEVLADSRTLPPMTGRAPYSRPLMAKAFKEVLSSSRHPKEEGGCLFITEEMRKAELNRRTEEQTNNHLIRHRLLILERLLADVVKEYAGGEKRRVGLVTIEVNRDLREMSGKTAKEIQQDLGQRLANHSQVVKELEEALGEDSWKITAGLIRKARVAADLGWRCPYTGKRFDALALADKEQMDKDHIIPRSLRPTDSLESLVVTYNEVNSFKKQRTALQFIEEEGGKPVPGKPDLTVMPLARYKELVDGLEAFKGHEDDKRRKKRRKELMLIGSYEEKELTPRDLTVTSHLVRMGAQKIERYFQDAPRKVRVVSLPGAVTGTVRKAWDVLGCLETANPEVLDENGTLKTKTEIRDVTHLHHALDACVLGFASHFIPNDGRVWELITKRTLAPKEEAELKQLGIFTFGKGGKFQLRDLGKEYKEEIRKRLAERRVVQHVPARMDGLRAEQNTWRVLEEKEDGEVTICQSRRGADGKREEKITTEKASKLLGLKPVGPGKLQRLKGVLVIPENYGVALDPKPTIIPFHKVAVRLRELREANAGKPVRVIRNGQLISVKTGTFKGIWKVFSAKNNAIGVCLDIGRPDVVRLRNKVDGHKINVRLSTLLKDGLTKIRCGLTGATPESNPKGS